MVIRPIFSIITVTLNAATTIQHTVASVKAQKTVSVEHIIKDGGSVDGTLEIALTENTNIRVLESSDRGIYDGMNQGFRVATGDYVGFLNGDDAYVDESVLFDVAQVFESYRADFVYAGILMLDKNSHYQRRWEDYRDPEPIVSTSQFPHPALFVRREILEQIPGPFDPNLKISSDLKLGLILVRELKLKGRALPRVVVSMALGGKSTGSIRNIILGWSESRQAYNELFSSGGTAFVIKKVLSKIPQLFTTW